MPISSGRRGELEKSGYKHNFDRDLYINENYKVIITEEAIEDHDDAWLDQQLTTCDGNNWCVICSDSKNDAQKYKILNDLGL